VLERLIMIEWNDLQGAYGPVRDVPYFLRWWALELIDPPLEDDEELLDFRIETDDFPSYQRDFVIDVGRLHSHALSATGTRCCT